MSIKIYSSETRKKHDFETVKQGEVSMYVCGPTVYDLLHVGNFRGPVVFNMIRNWLEKSGYKVTYVYNYTDVDDKIINRAAVNKETPEQLTERTIGYMHEDVDALNIERPNLEPRVTTHMNEIIAMIETLVAKKHA